MRIYDYKVIETLASGVLLKDPLLTRGTAGREPTYAQRLEAGLDELGQQGWKLTAVVQSTMMIFVREM